MNIMLLLRPSPFKGVQSQRTTILPAGWSKFLQIKLVPAHISPVKFVRHMRFVVRHNLNHTALPASSIRTSHSHGNTVELHISDLTIVLCYRDTAQHKQQQFGKSKATIPKQPMSGSNRD